MSMKAIVSRVTGCLRAVVVLVLIAGGSSLFAQGVLSGAQVGTVQLLRQDDGYITISGTNYNFTYDDTKVFLGAEEFDSAALDEGMVVRFTLSAQGVLQRIEIIGPANLVRGVTAEH